MRVFIICAIILLLLPAALADDIVSKESSGAFRGSMRYIIDIAALLEAGSTTLEGLQAGDFISAKMPGTPDIPRYQRTSIYLRRYDTSADTVIYDFGLEKQQVMAAGEVETVDFDLDGTDDMTIMFDEFENRDTIFTISVVGALPEEPEEETVVEDVETAPVVMPPMPPVEVPVEKPDPYEFPVEEEPEKSLLQFTLLLILVILFGIFIYMMVRKKR